jgi:hypothetical protein
VASSRLSKFLVGGGIAAALFLILALIPASENAKKKSGAGKKPTSLLDSLVGSVGERFGGETAIEKLPGFDKERYAALPEKEKAAYHNYLLKLEEDVRFLKNELRGEKPQMENLLQRYFPEQMKALVSRDPAIASGEQNSPEAKAFLERQGSERAQGGAAMKIDLIQEMLIRYSPRLTRDEKGKLEAEIQSMAKSLGH